jgi:uncharacterized protein (TIGR03435 family)
MSGNDWNRLTAVFLGLVVSLWAQPKTVAPRFDVVSIRLVPPDAPVLMRDPGFSSVLPGGRFNDPRISLPVMIGVAYAVKNGSQIVGLPNWAENTSYSIAAKAGEDFSAATPEDNLEQVRLMMRALLADRFHLQIHSETQNQKGLLLEVAKGGLKIKEVSAPTPPSKEGLVGAAARKYGGGRIVGTKATMAGLARCLTNCLRQPVIDHTGLKGYYDFDLTWTGEGQDTSASFGAFDFVAGAISTLRDAVGLASISTLPL